MYNFPKASDVEKLKPLIASECQKIYDLWEQDENGYDEEVGYGGICHILADKMVSIIDGNLDNPFVQTKSLSDEQHVNVLIALDDGIYEIDIPYRQYETGGGYQWTKREGIVFDKSFVTCECLDSNLENMYLFAEDTDMTEYMMSVKKFEGKQEYNAPSFGV